MEGMAQRYLLLFGLDGLLITHTDAGELIRTRGSWETLSQLQHRSDAVSSLVTETDAATAKAQAGEVSGVGLARYLDLDVGAYGRHDDGLAGLVAQARNRAKAKYGKEFTVVVVTGDSTADIGAAARVADAVVAVEPTEARQDELRAAGAGQVVPKLVGLVPLVLGAQVGATAVTQQSSS
jgi:phosphoglycolate phosphatase